MARLLAVRALPDSWLCCCSKFYATVKGKPSKFEKESSIPMEAIHSTHKVHLQQAWHAAMLLQTVPVSNLQRCWEAHSLPYIPGISGLLSIATADWSCISAVHAQAYIDELAKVLMEGADNPSTPAHARMCQLIKANVRAQPVFMVMM